MAELLNQIAAIIQQLIVTFGYPGIFLMQFAENVFPPVPTDTLLPFSGVVAASGRLHVLIVWLSAVSGGVSGSLVLYALGAWAKNRGVHQVIGRWGAVAGITEERLERVMEWFNRYGSPVIFFGRMLPVMRVVVSFAAGMSRMRLLPFVFFTALSSGLAMGFWIGVGYILGENWRVLLTLIDRFEPLILVAAVVGAAGLIGFWIVRRLRPQSLPVEAD